MDAFDQGELHLPKIVATHPAQIIVHAREPDEVFII